jgi:hypothetical protein
MWGLLFLLAFVFMITYDPKSGTLNKYIPIENAPCKEGHYQEVQFGQKGYDCPQGETSKLGAIVST